MTIQRTIRTAAALACAAFVLTTAAQASDRRMLVLNASDQPIFTVRVGHAEQNEWGPDLLPFNDVIDVSRGRDLDVVYDAPGCRYDVSATYRDGMTIVLRDVDLCSVSELRFVR